MKYARLQAVTQNARNNASFKKVSLEIKQDYWKETAQVRKGAIMLGETKETSNIQAREITELRNQTKLFRANNLSRKNCKNPITNN